MPYILTSVSRQHGFLFKVHCLCILVCYMTIIVLYYFIAVFITEDTGHIVWSIYDNSVRLTRASVIECEEIMIKLAREQHTVKEWSISLWYSSSPESTAIIINNLSKCTMKRLSIQHTPLDSKYVSIFSEILHIYNNLAVSILECRFSQTKV